MTRFHEYNISHTVAIRVYILCVAYFDNIIMLLTINVDFINRNENVFLESKFVQNLNVKYVSLEKNTLKGFFL